MSKLSMLVYAHSLSDLEFSLEDLDDDHTRYGVRGQTSLTQLDQTLTNSVVHDDDHFHDLLQRIHQEPAAPVDKGAQRRSEPLTGSYSISMLTV